MGRAVRDDLTTLKFWVRRHLQGLGKGADFGRIFGLEVDTQTECEETLSMARLI